MADKQKNEFPLEFKLGLKILAIFATGWALVLTLAIPIIISVIYIYPAWNFFSIVYAFIWLITPILLWFCAVNTCQVLIHKDLMKWKTVIPCQRKLYFKKPRLFLNIVIVLAIVEAPIFCIFLLTILTGYRNFYFFR